MKVPGQEYMRTTFPVPVKELHWEGAKPSSSSASTTLPILPTSTATPLAVGDPVKVSQPRQPRPQPSPPISTPMSASSSTGTSPAITPSPTIGQSEIDDGPLPGPSDNPINSITELLAPVDLGPVIPRVPSFKRERKDGFGLAGGSSTRLKSKRSRICRYSSFRTKSHSHDSQDCPPVGQWTVWSVQSALAVISFICIPLHCDSLLYIITNREGPESSRSKCTTRINRILFTDPESSEVCFIVDQLRRKMGVSIISGPLKNDEISARCHDKLSSGWDSIFLCHPENKIH